MKTPKIELNHVHYNAATQSFEGLVTLKDGQQTHSYPCAINAPIDMSFERASEGLTQQALRRHGKPHGLRSLIKSRIIAFSTLKPRRGLPEGQYGFFRGRAA